MNKRQQRYAYWKQIMDRYESSDLSQQKFCEANSIDFRKFKYYRYRLSLTRRLKKTKTSTPSFIPVKLNQSPKASSEKICLLHPSGIECSFPTDLEESVLLNFLRSFKSC